MLCDTLAASEGAFGPGAVEIVPAQENVLCALARAIEVGVHTFERAWIKFWHGLRPAFKVKRFYL